VNDYERIAKVIRYLDTYQVAQPDLKELAGVIGLSEAHFHRLFSRWAGITPKDFLQCLTMAHAKQRLLSGDSVLASALHAGLSGPSRLHDLSITLEAASPGELKRKGEGWTLEYAFVESPFGRCLMAEGPRGIVHVGFVDDGEETALEDLRTRWPRATLDECVDLKQQGLAYFKCGPTGQPLKAYVCGSDFQIKVWRALLAIPQGGLTTYGRLAKAVERPGSERAVGTAVGKNPLGVLIPCHRVIRETGALGGYRWGLERKRVLLIQEAGQADRVEAQVQAKN